MHRPEPPTTRRALVMAAVLSGTFVSAIEMTIVGTAMPRIAGALHGSDVLTWVISVYLLTSTIAAALFGKLADQFGRKPSYQASMALFLAGSALSGAAQSMPWLIAARALQGLGGGGLTTVGNTVVGDLYTPVERGRMQGFFSGVWGFSGAVGPLAGGLIVDHLSWRWVFYLNVPFGLVAMALMHYALHERAPRRAAAIDYAGALAFAAAVTALQLGAGGAEGSRHGDLRRVAVIAAGVALLALFAWIETRAEAPILPPKLLARRVVASALGATLLSGAVMFGVTIFVPLYIQGVEGSSASAAGAVMTPLLAAWPLLSVTSGLLIAKVDVRAMVRTGALLLVAGAALLVFARPGSNGVLFPVAGGLVGAGMGLSSTPLLIALQSAVGWEERGVVTAGYSFCRTMGGTVGVVVAGAVYNARLAARDVAASVVDAMLRPGAHGGDAAARGALSWALDGAFVALVGLGLATLFAAFAFPRSAMPIERGAVVTAAGE